jgi:hypothetical protein
MMQNMDLGGLTASVLPSFHAFLNLDMAALKGFHNVHKRRGGSG